MYGFSRIELGGLGQNNSALYFTSADPLGFGPEILMTALISSGGGGWFAYRSVGMVDGPRNPELFAGE